MEVNPLHEYISVSILNVQTFKLDQALKVRDIMCFFT